MTIRIRFDRRVLDAGISVWYQNGEGSRRSRPDPSSTFDDDAGQYLSHGGVAEWLIAAGLKNRTGIIPRARVRIPSASARD